MQDKLENYFDDPIKNSGTYYDLSRYAGLQAYSQDIASLLFAATGVHSLNIFQRLPFFGPRVMAITSTFIHRDVIPFYIFLVLLLVSFALALQFAFGNEIMEYRSSHASIENTWYILFGDFGIGFEEMQESTMFGAYGVLFMLSIILTLVMMNIFIAVVSDVYGKAYDNAQKYFEKHVVDSSYYLMRSDKIRTLMIDHYLSQTKDKTKQKLKEVAREIQKSQKETQPETLRRLLSRGNQDTAKQLHVIQKDINILRKTIIEIRNKQRLDQTH